MSSTRFRTCSDCGGDTGLLGEDITEVLEYTPGRFHVKRYARPKMACKSCDAISQAPAPALPIPRGRAGPGLLAHVVVSKYADHLPLYRQSQIFKRDGIDLSRSTLADWVGQVSWLLDPLVELISKHVLASEKIHTDDTTVPVLSPGKGKTKTGRLWTYVRDNRDWNDKDPPAVRFYYSRDRKAEHPKKHLRDFAGFMQADGYPGYDQLYDKARKPGPIVEVACWAHVRRKIFDVHEAEKSVAAKEALDQIALLYAAEKQLKRAPNWMTRVAGRVDSRKQAQSFFHWAEGILGQISAKMPLALALRYAITRKDALLRFTENGQLEIDNNAAERSIRGIALGRKNYMFAGPDSGGDNAAAMYSLIETAKLNKVDPEAWLADVLRRVGEGHPVNRLDELLPWNWTDETADIPEDGIPATEGELAIVEGLRNNVLARDLPDGGWNFEQAGGRKADGNGRFYVLLSTYSGTR